MNKFLKLEDLILEIQLEHPKSRSNDTFLFCYYLQRKGYNLKEMTVSELFNLIHNKKLSNYETISRTGRMVRKKYHLKKDTTKAEISVKKDVKEFSQAPLRTPVMEGSKQSNSV